jgi:hypothetical protein
MIRGALPGYVREYFLLERAHDRSARLSDAQRRSIQRCHEAAMQRLSVADELRRSEPAVALSLYRDAAWLLAAAFLASRDASLDVGSLDRAAAFDRMDTALAAESPETSAGYRAARPAFTVSDLLAADGQADARDPSMEAVAAAARWMSRLVDPRSPVTLKRARFVRIAAMCALGVGVVAGSVRWGMSPKNLSRDKPARASSVAYSTHPMGAVDGRKNGRFGFHTAEEDSPWLVIDLRQPSTIHRVEVFGRDDCCFDQSIPLALEVSDDGNSFRGIAERITPFSESDPWVVDLSPKVARFVRLRREQRGILALSEVEVYGWPK